jgi:AraC-like DNA-binding protein
VDEKDKRRGLESGADAYLTKPFHTAELKVIIRNLILIRHSLREKFGTDSIINVGEIPVNSKDSIMVEKLLQLLDSHLNNVSYSVEELARDAGMSHSQLHRKLKSAVNMTPIQFVRSVRLHRARELLLGGAGNIAEVAFTVGYDDPGYFTKSYRKFFGHLPSEHTPK